MMPSSSIHFGAFHLEIEPACLWQGSQQIALRPRTLAMLQYLVTHPGRVVTKTELRQHVWDGAHFTDNVLRTCAYEIRAALGDRADAPTYLETVRGEGYRFLIGRDVSAILAGTADCVVGRQREMDQLTETFYKAAMGERQFVLLNGEPGIGKTTLVKLFLNHIAGQTDIRVSQSQCVIHYGESEAYRPVLEALGRLGAQADGSEITRILWRHAPLWLVQLPTMVRETELKPLQRRVQGATPARMVRELCEAIEVLTTDTPLILVIEDLHWCDVSTLELLAALAQRPEFARLLMLGTYRPADAVLHTPVLRDVLRELRDRHHCDELAIELLTEVDVSSYVTSRLGDAAAASLVHYLFQQSGGNPLFLVNLFTHLVQHDAVDHHHGQWVLAADKDDVLENVPEELRSVIRHRLEKQSEADRQLLEAASVAGVTFSTAAVAAGLEQMQDDIESACEPLGDRRDFLETIGIETWPDGTLTGHYRFRHALYQQVVYEQLSELRRVQLHRRIAERMAAGHGAQVRQIATELVFHFEQGHDAHRAASYRYMAAEQALSRHAYREASVHLQRLLDELHGVPETPERDQQELALLTMLGPALVALYGYAAPQVEQLYSRAQALCSPGSEASQHFPVLWSLCAFYLVRGELQQGRALAEHMLEMARPTQDVALQLMAHDALAQICCWQGALTRAREHAEQGIAYYDPQQHHGLAARYGHEDPRVACMITQALTLWLQGYPAQARACMQKVLEFAREFGNPHTLAFALIFASFLHQFCHDATATQSQTETLLTLATDAGFAHWVSMGTCFRGWALVRQGRSVEGLAQIEEGLHSWQATGSMLAVSYFMFLHAEAYFTLGQLDAAQHTLSAAQALAKQQGEHWWAAEISRLDGELVVIQEDHQPNMHDAETRFQQALDIARQQEAKSLELRAATSLARLWQSQGKHQDAYDLLAPVYSWFTEGFDTADLQDAKIVLEALTSPTP